MIFFQFHFRIQNNNSKEAISPMTLSTDDELIQQIQNARKPIVKDKEQYRTNKTFELRKRQYQEHQAAVLATAEPMMKDLNEYNDLNDINRIIKMQKKVGTRIADLAHNRQSENIQIQYKQRAKLQKNVQSQQLLNKIQKQQENKNINTELQQKLDIQSQSQNIAYKMNTPKESQKSVQQFNQSSTQTDQLQQKQVYVKDKNDSYTNILNYIYSTLNNQHCCECNNGYSCTCGCSYPLHDHGKHICHESQNSINIYQRQLQYGKMQNQYQTLQAELQYIKSEYLK